MTFWACLLHPSCWPVYIFKIKYRKHFVVFVFQNYILKSNIKISNNQSILFKFILKIPSNLNFFTVPSIVSHSGPNFSGSMYFLFKADRATTFGI